jgi:hypothetical protein
MLIPLDNRILVLNENIEPPKLPDGYFKRTYGKLRGKDWLKNVSDEDRQAFSKIGFAASNYGRNGGVTRAKTAKRDHKGRFIKEN